MAFGHTTGVVSSEVDVQVMKSSVVVYFVEVSGGSHLPCSLNHQFVTSLSAANAQVS